MDYSYVRTFARNASLSGGKVETTPDAHGGNASGTEDGEARVHRVEADGAVSMESTDSRAIQDVASLTNLIQSLVHHDVEEKQHAFDVGFYHCQICFEEKMGTECLRFPHCEHVYCKLCITEYFNVQITDGNVKALTCPEQKCDSQASQTQVSRHEFCYCIKTSFVFKYNVQPDYICCCLFTAHLMIGGSPEVEFTAQSSLCVKEIACKTCKNL